ncbi:hypothetical protein AB0284_20430 [Pseudarthrobacter phenanthrenivorans]|uniref:hypothetical protein n=1 Tax=Pseudarthrobacter phenanthrenivorans TaxID=361575 RepID=UPI00344D8551
MSTIVIHSRSAFLSRVLWSVAIMVGEYFLAQFLHCESVPQALWQTLKEVVPAFLDGIHTIANAVRGAKL